MVQQYWVDIAYRNSPKGNGVIFQWILQVSHHVYTNKPVKWFDDIQAYLYHHKQKKNNPIMHVKPGYLNTMWSKCVGTQLNLRHPDGLEQIE